MAYDAILRGRQRSAAATAVRFDPATYDWAHARRREFSPAYPRFIELTSLEEWANEIAQPWPPQPWDGFCLTTVAHESDTTRLEFLQRIGYEATRHFAPDYRRDLSASIPDSRLTERMTLRHVTKTDIPRASIRRRRRCTRDAGSNASTPVGRSYGGCDDG